MAGAKRGLNTRIKVVGGWLTFSMKDAQLVEWRRPVEHFAAAARDFSPVFEAYARYMERSIDRNFAAEGRPDRWAGLQPATIVQRIQLGFGAGPILQRTGRLKRSFRFTWGPRSFRISNLAHYFPHHQFGAPRANIPQRAMIVLLDQDKREFTKMARRHLMPGAKR